MCIRILSCYHSVPKSFICCCSGRDSCMLTSRCMLPWLHSAPYPTLCPCEPLRARSTTCKPCPMALVPDSTVHCARPPARNLDLSSSDHAQGPWVGFIYIQLSKHLKNGPDMPINTLPRLARSTLNELQQNQHEKASLACVRVQSPSGLALVPCALSMVHLSGQLRC